MIWPPGKTSTRNRPPLISSTTLASRWAEPCSWSSTEGKAVDMRHCTFGCAMTFGASTIVAAPTAVSAPLADTRNRRRSVIIALSLSRHELVVGAFGHVVPRTHQRLELRERRVHLARHGRLFRLFPDDLGRLLPEIAQHRRRKLEHLDLSLELSPESLERDGVLRVVVRKAVDLNRCRGVVERPPQVDGQRFVRLAVEGELVHRAGILPARVVVMACRLMETQLHVVVRTDPLGRIDNTSLESGIDVGGRSEDGGRSSLRHDLAPEVGPHAHLETLVVADRGELLLEPSGRLGGKSGTLARHEVEGRIGLFPELEPVALVVPSCHALRIHAERNRPKPLDRGLLREPIHRRSHESVDGALRGRVEGIEGLHDLAARKDLDPEAPAARLLDHLGQPQGRTMELVERRRIGGRQPPLELRLRDDVGGVDDRGGRSSRYQATRRHDESAAFACHGALLTPPQTDGTRLRRCGPTGPPGPGTSRRTRAPSAPWASSRILP